MEMIDNTPPATETHYVPHAELTHWSPKARIGAGLVAIAIVALARKNKGLMREIAIFAGLSLLLRSLLNKDFTQVIGMTLSPTIRLNRQIYIDAPAEEVLKFLTNIENFPCFMSFVRKVETNRYGNLLWEMHGPGGLRIHWETAILSWKPSPVIAWRTLPGSPIFNSGRIEIQTIENEKSNIEVNLAYALRAGSLGHAAAKVFGFDPRTHIDVDLKKMKSLIEDQWTKKQETELPLSS